MNKSEITTKINLDASTLLNLSGDDLRMLHKKVIVNKFLEEKTMNSRKPVASIAKELGISKSSLDRYKTEIGLTSYRNNPQYSTERKREITMKTLASRKRNQMYKEELRSIMNNKDLTKDEVDSEFEKLRSHYSTTTTTTTTMKKPPNQQKTFRGGNLDDEDQKAIAKARDIASKLKL